MKKLLITFASSKTIFSIVAAIIILGFNLTPLILQLRHAPPSRTFALIHNNVQDFFFYQALMNEGGGGVWFTSDPYTSEPHKSSIIFSYFLWLGKFSNLFGLPYAITYHLVRLVLGIFLLSVVCYLLFFLKIPYPRLAFLFFLFAAPFLHTVVENGQTRTVPFMNWWTGMDPIRRAAYLPHHMFGSLILVITFIMFLKFMKTHNYKYIIWAILFAALLAFVHTPSLLIILLVLPVTIVIYYLFHPDQIGRNLKPIIILSVFWVIGLLFLFLMVSQTKNGFPWSQYIAWEKKLQFPLDRELIQAFGILLPFAILGIIKAFFSRRLEYILVACWFIVPLLLIPIAPSFNLSNIRLIQGAPYLPLAILATIGIKSLIDFIFSSKICAVGLDFVAELRKGKRELKFPKASRAIQLTKAFQEPILRERKNLTLLFVLIIFLIFTFPTLSWSLQDQIREYWPIFGNVYFDNRLYTAFAYINQNFPKDTITLSTFYTGNYLPAFTHIKSFIGHFGYTYRIEEKETQVRKFFENKMTDQEAKEFLVNNKIVLIFQGPEEKPIYSSYLYPKILKPVYDLEEVTLYILNF